eukprot:jgi/Picsp_1/5262/NSC_02624-R1_related dnase
MQNYAEEQFNGSEATSWAVDAHCHLQDPRLDAYQDGIFDSLPSHRIKKLVVNSTSPKNDWTRVLEMWRQRPDVVLPQFGVHPWYVHEALSERQGWESELRRLLQLVPCAGVGETGLDKSPKWKGSIEEQEKVFQCHIKVALEMKRPLSVHCVKSYGRVYEHIKHVQGAVPIVLHGWMGSKDMVNLFAKLPRVYFSINTSILRLEPLKGIRMLGAIPLDRLMVESDCPDGVPCEDNLRLWIKVLDSESDAIRLKTAFQKYSNVQRGIFQQEGTSFSSPHSLGLTMAVIGAATGHSSSLLEQAVHKTAINIFLI